MREAMSYLQAVRSETGWAIYDPQLDRSVGLTDEGAMADQYEAGTRQTQQIARGEVRPQEPAKKRKRFGLF
jgi:hypothetical protein